MPSSLPTGCTAPDVVEIEENNDIGDLVVEITLQPGATVTLSPSESAVNPVTLNGSRLFADIVFDAEVTPLASGRTNEVQTRPV